MLEKRNQVIICKDCGKEFDFTVGEQEYFERVGLTTPVRCKECREARKAQREAQNEESRSNRD